MSNIIFVVHCRRYFILLLVVISLTSCKFDTSASRISKGTEIDWKTRKEIRQIGNQVFDELKLQKTDYLKGRLSDSLKVNFREIDSVLQAIQVTTDGQVNNYGEFLIENSPNLEVSWVSSTIGKEKYYYYFKPTKPLGYVYLFSVPDISKKHEVLVALYLEKESEKWVIEHFHIGYFMYEHFMGPELAYSAMSIFDRGYILPAIVQMLFAAQLMKPAGNNFHFENEQIIQAHAREMLEEVYRNYRFPMIISGIPTLPKIFQISSLIRNGKLCPLLIYRSNISLFEENSLKRENELLDAKMESIFPGIKYIGDSILYQVLNDVPDSNRSVASYNFIKAQYETK